MKRERMELVKKRWLTSNIVEMTLRGDIVGLISQPGQFLHIAASEKHTLRRPISIADYSKDLAELTILFRVEGSGTRWLSERSVFTHLDVVGPLGNGFHIDALQRTDEVLLIGGGIGIPPLYGVAKKLAEQQVKTTHILGFATETDAFLVNEFHQLGETYCTTVDGSLGQKGYVTDVVVDVSEHATVFSCGPAPMLKAVKEVYGYANTFLSLEDRMGCGIGICYACVCSSTDGKHDKKVCIDGPVFPAKKVVLV